MVDLYRVQTKKVVAAVFVKNGIVVDSAPVFKKQIGKRFEDFLKTVPELENYRKLDSWPIKVEGQVK